MALNYPGPFEARIFYTTSVTPGGAIQHVMKLNFTHPVGQTIAPGQSFGTIGVQIRSGIPVTLAAAVDGLVTVLQPLYSQTQATFDFAECWAYEPESFDATFISAYAIGLPGTNTSPNNVHAAGHDIWVFRTQEGGIMKLNLMENASGLALPQTYADLGGVTLAIADYFLSSNIWTLARDTSYPIALKGRFPGENEALFKRRYRP